MTKPLIPLALGVALLGGCATMNAFNDLKTSVTDNGITVARAITLTNKAHVYLTWYRPNATVTSITRRNGSAFEASVTPPAAGTSFVEDTATPDIRTDIPYNYDLNFSAGSKITRFITPISAVSETATLNEPPSDIAGLNKQTKKPTFKWTRLNSIVESTKALAYMITVAEIDPATLSDPSKFSAAAANVKYSALIDPTKHTTGNSISIELGAKSDIGLATELLDAIGSAGSGSSGNLSALKPKDGDSTAALEAGKVYAWTVTPIVYTKDQTAFALGNMAAPFFFQVQ